MLKRIIDLICFFIFISLINSCNNSEKINESKKERELSKNEFYYANLISYEWKGKTPVIEIKTGEHEISIINGSWSEENKGLGLYFYTYRNPEIFINFFNNLFKQKPKITEKHYVMPYPDITDWKFYQWKSDYKFQDGAIQEFELDVRKYYASSDTYIPYYEFFLKPIHYGKPEITEKNDNKAIAWKKSFRKRIDSIVRQAPVFSEKNKHTGGIYFYQTNPINFEEINNYLNQSKFKTYSQIILPLEIDTNGNITRCFKHYYTENEENLKLFDSVFISKLKFPIVSFLGKPIPYETLFFFEKNPYQTKKNIFQSVLRNRKNNEELIEGDQYEFHFFTSKKGEFCFGEIGMDSIYVWQKRNEKWDLIYDRQLKFDSWSKYYASKLSINDFNGDGFMDYVLWIGEPFNGTGSRFLEIYLYDSTHNSFKFIPEFSEFDMNEIFTIKDKGKFYTLIYTSGSNFGLAQKYKYTWDNLNPLLLEYGTGVVIEDLEDEKKPTRFITTFYSKKNKQLIKIWEKTEIYTGEGETYFDRLIFPDSLLKW